MDNEKNIDYFLDRTDTLLLYRYRRLNEANVDSLFNHYLWFTEPGALRDPFNGVIYHRTDYSTREIYAFYAALNTRLNLGIEETTLKTICEQGDPQEVLKTSDQLALTTLKMCCFTTKPDDLLMWTQYAGSHTGFVLEFEVLKDTGCFLTPFKVEYENECLTCDSLDFTSEELYFERLLKRKFKGWEYEQEVRVVKKEVPNRINYLPTALRSVIFGVQTPDENIQQIKEGLSDYPHIQFRKCTLNKRIYQLDITDI